LINTTNQELVSLWVKINLWTLLMKNSNLFTLDILNQELKETLKHCSELKDLPIKLIGDKKELSPQLKTKDNVVHAGPSQLSELLKDFMP
jgi:hypothetical protein